MQTLPCFRQFAVTFLVLGCAPMQSLHAVTFDERHERDVAANPPDLQFRLSVANQETRFHIGERIPIVLEFSSSSVDKYKLDGAAYDRSGRLPSEEFVVDRDVTDPYRDYFGLGVLGGLGGGLRTIPVLGPTPHAIPLELNDWFRFDHPGVYRLYLKSHRLSRERAPDEPGEGRTVQFAAVSNVIEIMILPQDQSWEVAKLAEIRRVLDEPQPDPPARGDSPLPYRPVEEKTAFALRELRYLETPSSIRLMLEQARKSGGALDTLGLIGARDRIDMLVELDRYLADPHVGISAWDIRVRALFTFVEKDTPEVLPIFGWQLSTLSNVQQVLTLLEPRQKRFQQLVREEAVRLIALVEQKDTAARKVSAQAIAMLAPEAAKAAGLVPPDDYGLTREQLISQFDQFPASQQSELLTKKWDLVRGAEMIPVLKRLIARAEPRSLPQDAMMLRVWGASEDLAAIAVRRLNELAPGDAVAILRKDIATGKPRFAGFAVRELPAQDIREADAALAALLKTNLNGALPLIAKFGTSKLAGQMRSLYNGPLWPCAEEEAFTSYFVRTLPGEGPGQGGDVLRRAMADRERRGCYRMLLGQVAEVVWNPTIEAQAIASLDDSDPEAATSAAFVLAAHGGASVEPLLWKRLERWSDQWRGRAQELLPHPITDADPNGAENRLGAALFNAIGSAKSWVIDEPRRTRLRALCIDDWCRKRWADNRSSDSVSVDVSSGGPAYPAAFRVDGYSASTLNDLQTKLQHYAAGTKFQWCPQVSNPFDVFTPGQREEMFEQLSAFLRAHSMSIEPYSDKECMPGIARK